MTAGFWAYASTDMAPAAHPRTDLPRQVPGDDPASSDALPAGAGLPAAGLVVTPGSALFDVDLARGIPEVRELTVQNTANIAYDVQLSIEPSAGAPDEHRRDHLQVISTGTYDSCTAETLAPLTPRTMREVNRVSHDVIAAGTTRTLCIGVVMPTTAPDLAPATTMVDILVHASALPGDVGDRLAFTGTDAARFIPAALFAILAGLLMIALAANRRDHAASEHPTPVSSRLSASHPESVSR